MIIHVVDIWEHERRWGKRVDSTCHFDSEEEARKFVRNYNSKNTRNEIPDWYMRAEYSGLKEIITSAIVSQKNLSNLQMFKQQQAHPKYPVRGELDIPVYFNHDVVGANIRSKDKPTGWADPFWDQMTDKEKIAVLTKVPMSGPFETRVFSEEPDYSGPINPKGFTGMIGRGLLGCYGPNFAADPIVTRFNNGVLEMAAIQRSDTGEWAIPGGMVERGATVSATLRNEFNEEALGNTLGTGDAEYSSGVHNCGNVKSKEDAEYISKIKELQSEVDKLFDKGTVVYKGWVDDPRNTDWAWMETVAVHFHIEDDSPLHGIELRPATDATGAKWYRLDKPSDLKKLYASHGEFVLNAIKKRTETDKDSKWSNTFLNLMV